MKKNLISLILLVVFFTGCDPYTQDDYVEQYVVETFLTANQPFPEIKVSTTLPFDQPYIFEDAAISGADVVVKLLTEDKTIEDTISYMESDRPGIYIPTDTAAVVLPKRRYALEVTNLKAPEDRIRATTFVPGEFDLISINADSLIYQGPVQFKLDLEQGFYPGRQNIYVATSLALDPENFSLTPFWENVDGEEGEFVRVSSGLVNEGNYDLNEDGTLTLQYPWIGIAYFGPNELSVYAVDTNIFDYIRTFDIQGGGSTLSPGQIENVLWNVEGGIGIFGSRTGVSAEVFIKNAF